MRNLVNHIKADKPLPHRLVPTLVTQCKIISTFAGHADVNSFVHRIRQTTHDGQKMMGVEYFQFGKSDAERKNHALTFFHTFVMRLDIFADFLVVDKVVPEKWKEELHRFCTRLERRHKDLKAEAGLVPPEAASPST